MKLSNVNCTCLSIIYLLKTDVLFCKRKKNMNLIELDLFCMFF